LQRNSIRFRPEVAQNQRFSANSGANSVSLPKFAVE
jgi:hypothetical protein